MKDPQELWIEVPDGSDVWTLLARRTPLGIEVRMEGRVRWGSGPWHPLWKLFASAAVYSKAELDRIWDEGGCDRA